MRSAHRAGVAAFAAASFAALLFAPTPAVAGWGQCLQADLQPTPSELPAYERSVVCLINNERRFRGLDPLSQDTTLARAGRRQSADMVARRYFAHITPGGSDVVARLRRAGYPLTATHAWTVGEVLSWGVQWRSTPRATVQAWMDSPPHKAVLLRRDVDQVGAGAALGNPVLADDDGVTVSVEVGHVG